MIEMFPPTTRNVVAVLSGGLDSTIMTRMLVNMYGVARVSAISFNYGQKQIRELAMAGVTCDDLGIEHKIVDFRVLGDIVRSVSANIKGTGVDMPTITDVLGDPQPVTYVPFRNMILNSVAFSYAEVKNASIIFTGLQSRDLYGYWDTSSAFVDNMNAVASLNRQHQIRLHSPFVNLTKKDEIEMAQKWNFVHKLRYTLSCYNPDTQGRSCGTCPTCAERIKAFMDLKLVDPIEYQKEIKWIR